MNTAILRDDVQAFINKNINIDIPKLILKGTPFTDVSIQELANQIAAKKKSKTKLSTWFESKNIYYPPKVSIEQTSSEITAEYKSNLVSGNSIIDITGGFGIDAFYFSKQFEKVTHCEINEELSEIVSYNYKKLEVTNIETKAINGFDYLKQTTETFDCIYIDPSRRSDVKGKVFLLKDCQPYIPPKIDFFFTKASTILIKVSPILDITNTIKDLKNVKEVHVVAVQNEVKELLFLLEKDYESTIEIKTVNITKQDTEHFEFTYKEEANVVFAKPRTYLFEPNAAIMKSGGFNQVSEKLGVYKLHEHSHLYTSVEDLEFPGRKFIVNKVLDYDKKKFKKEFLEKKANVTTRNFTKTVAQIRKELKLKDGGKDYIFCTTDVNKRQKIIICSKP